MYACMYVRMYVSAQACIYACMLGCKYIYEEREIYGKLHVGFSPALAHFAGAPILERKSCKVMSASRW